MKRFWIARLSALGDVVCSLPAAGELKRRFPDCEITWVVSPGLRGVVEACPWVDHVVAIKPGLNPASWPVGDGEYDAAFDLQGLTKSAVSIAKVRAKVKLGYHWQREAAFLFSAPVVPDATSRHVVDQYVDVVRAYGGDSADLSPHPQPPSLSEATSLSPESGVLSSADLAPHPQPPLPGAERGLLECPPPMGISESPPPTPSPQVERGLSEAPPISSEFPSPCPLPTSGEGVLRPQVPNPLIIENYVVINPGAGWVSKRWPPASIAAICDFLREHGYTPVLIGGPGEEEIADEVASQTKSRPEILTGRTSIPQLIAVIAGASAHLGGDTGSTHLAAALNVPAVGLYSSTRPERSCPYGQIHRCLRNPEGLSHITVDQVRAKLNDALGL